MLIAAWQDFTDACRRWPLWCYLGSIEIRLKYRRSALGPWWVTMSMVIFVISLSIVNGRLFHQDPKQYLPFLFCGFVFWNFISMSINESTELFHQARAHILQIKFPYFIFIFKHIYKHLLMTLHNLVVFFPIILYCRIPLTFHTLLVIPGMILLILNVAWICVCVSLVASRFRDLPPIISSLLQIVFFISPITWMPHLLGDSSIIIRLNPITWLLQVVRDPLLGIKPEFTAWVLDSSFVLIGFCLAFAIFARVRTRIPFWLV